MVNNQIKVISTKVSEQMNHTVFCIKNDYNQTKYLWISELGVDRKAAVPAPPDLGAALAVAGHAVPLAFGGVNVHGDDPHLGGEGGEEAAPVTVEGQAVFDGVSRVHLALSSFKTEQIF